MTQIRVSNMESLPKQFISAMQTLFDIMDDKHTGHVRLTDIENRWCDDRTKGLPRGVIESLQKVASHDGLLTFERFCTGLKICLLRNQVENVSSKGQEFESTEELESKQTQQKNNKTKRPPSVPLLDSDETHVQDTKWNGINKNEHIIQQRTITSLPQLMIRKDIPGQDLRSRNLSTTVSSHDLPIIPYGPPKPPRLENSERKELKRFSYKAECEIPLQCKDNPESKLSYDDVIKIVEDNSRGHGDGMPDAEVSTQLTARRGTRRREPRRHTLHNGIDYNLIRRMKQIEQEKDVLVQGLTAVEEAREWYLKQLGEVQERIRYAGRMGTYVEPWSEAQQERLELLRARVQELNRQLVALAAGWRRGPLSLHMNLALPATSGIISNPHQANILRTQNKMLAEEVNRKNEKINALEREKSALIRELFMQRNRTKLMENFS